jgi:hypothetical protein
LLRLRIALLITDIVYIGMDVHKEAIAIAVMNGDGKLVMESILETQGDHHLAVYPGTTR